jgi:hypothetical protein
VSSVQGAPQKPQKGHGQGQVLPHPCDRLIDRLKHRVVERSLQDRVYGRRIAKRLEPRAFALDKPNPLPKRMGHNQNIGKQDRGIEAEAADRL